MMTAPSGGPVIVKAKDAAVSIHSGCWDLEAIPSKSRNGFT